MCKPTTNDGRLCTTRNNKQTHPFVKPRFVFNICAYNVRTLHEEHLDNFLVELEHVNLDVIGLCETKLKSETIEPVKEHHMLYNSGVGDDSTRKYGVGFLVHRNLKDCVI